MQALCNCPFDFCTQFCSRAPYFVFIVLSYSTNMLVFRVNTNLFGTNVAWLSYSWWRPWLVGVSRYPGWHYQCYWHWISLAVGGDDLITRSLVDTNLVPRVAIHTFAPAPGKKNKKTQQLLLQPLTVSLFCTWSQNGGLAVD